MKKYFREKISIIYKIERETKKKWKINLRLSLMRKRKKDS